MSYHLEPHLPRLVAVVAMFICVKKSEQFDILFLVILFLCIYFHAR